MIDRAKIEAEKRRRASGVAIVNEAPDPLKWIQDEVTIEDPHKASTNAIIKFILWAEQIKYLKLLHERKQTITLKARQLGISWVTIVYCVWLCIFHRGVTVLVFSKDKDAAEEIIRRARGVFKRLANPPVRETGKENVKSINFSNGSRFKAFAATKNAGTSFTATFLIVDEADKMEYGKQLYTSIRPTISDGGRIAVIFTAFEEDGMGRQVWEIAGEEGSGITRFFIPWHARPGRTIEWYNREAAGAISMAHHYQEYPATPEEALSFTGLDSRLIREIEQWTCLGIVPNEISPYLPCVMAVDAGVTSDLFVAVTAVWHPSRILPVIRDVKTWNPSLTESGTLDFREPQDWIRGFISSHSVKEVVYDPYQLVQFGQELERMTNAKAFSQGVLRMSADTSFRNRILQGQVGHLNDPELNLHISNANIKVVADSNKLRIVKRNKAKKIDLAVASSMAVYELVTEFAFDMGENQRVMSGSNYASNPIIGSTKPFQGLPNSLYKRIIK